MKIPVVILCGGQGTRLREETEFKPKPLVEVGGIPILVHIMNWYRKHGFKDFVLCTGYKEEMIRAWFESHPDENVEIAYTGDNAMTGARLMKVERYLPSRFMLTYGDGLCDVDINKLFVYHCSKDTIGTLTGVHPISKYGHVKVGRDGIAKSFIEKPVMTHELINGGFYVFEREFFDYLKPDDNVVLEKQPLMDLVEKKGLSVYRHHGFWMGMDTYKDYLDLNNLWKGGGLEWLKCY